MQRISYQTCNTEHGQVDFQVCRMIRHHPSKKLVHPECGRNKNEERGQLHEHCERHHDLQKQEC